MVKSYIDSVKQKARDKLREFIANNLKSDYKNARVLCFPGAEHKGEEALEIKEVYDVLGIPRKNIVGMEYDAKNAERLRKADLGIETVCSDAMDYVQRTDRKFDIISLDYTGQRTWKERDITRYIAGRGIIDKLGIFCTNHMIRREGNYMKKKLIEQSVFNDSFHPFCSVEFLSLPSNERKSLLNKFVKQYNGLVSRALTGEEKLDSLRDAITIDNVQIFSCGITEIDPMYHILANKPYFRVQRPLEDAVIDEMDTYECCKGIESSKDYWKKRSQSVSWELSLRKDLIKKGMSEKEAFAIVKIQLLRFQQGRIIRNIERYTYNSNKNAKMLMDIMALKPMPYSLTQGANEIVNINASDCVISYNPHGYSGDKVRKKMKKLTKSILSELSFCLPAQIYLGSSWKQPKRKEKISKGDAIELLKGGCSAAEIAGCYAGFSKKQLAAFQAHYVTMGKEFTDI